MGIEQPVMSGAVKTGGFFISPLGRTNLIITGVVFLILAFVGLSESFSQHSGYPFVSRALLPIIGADTQIGQMVDDLESSPRPVFDSVVSKSFPAWLWFWLKFWFLIVANIWFIYFFCWLIYGFWYMMNTDLIARNIIFTIITFLILSLFIGMIMYNVRLSGLCLPDDRAKNFNLQMKNTFPLHGLTKFFVHFINKDLFYRVADWSATDFGRLVTNIPVSPNVMNDSINVSVS
jgi:hypothetical protein